MSNPDPRDPPYQTGARMTEGVFPSARRSQGGDADSHPPPIRTISLTDFQRRLVNAQYRSAPRQVLPRRNAGLYLRPRAPDATVTASVVEINLNDGTTTSKVTEVPAATSDNVVSLSDLGTLTAPATLTVPAVSNATGTGNATETSSRSGAESSQDTITTPATTTSPSGRSTTTSSSSDLSPAGTVLSEALNSTAPATDSTSAAHTITVTATSTLEISLINGTIVAPATFEHVTATDTDADTATITRSSSRSSALYTFGQAESTLTGFDSSSDAAVTGTQSGSYPGAVVGTSAFGSPTTSSGSVATSGSGSGSNSGSATPGLTPQQQQVVGGVVGGVAGVAVVLVILLFALRWYRRRLKVRGQLPEQLAARDIPGGPHGAPYPMSQRSSAVPLAATVANSLKRLRPHSHHTFDTTGTAFTDSSVGQSERGFQRIAGRKIAPVLGTGGDPYGGNYGAFEKDTMGGPTDPLHSPEAAGLSGSSFYRDQDGLYGGRGASSPTFPPSPTTSGPTVGAARNFAEPRSASGRNSSQVSLTSPSRPEGFAVMRPSPARTPVTLSPATSSIRLPIQQPPIMDDNAPPLPGGLTANFIQGDAVGRSLASLDGSRVSRSSGRSGARFVENI